MRLAPLALAALLFGRSAEAQHDGDHSISIYRLDATTIEGAQVSLQKYAGRVSLFVNIASRDAAAAENLAELNVLYNKYRNRGFEVMAFPCNQFGQQEPHTNKWIKEWAHTSDVEFPLFAKTNVKEPECLTKAGCGPTAAVGDECCNVNNGIWKLLRVMFSNEGKIKWNFAKFLVARDGRPIKRYAHNVSPIKIEKDIRYHLGLDRRPVTKSDL